MLIDPTTFKSVSIRSFMKMNLQWLPCMMQYSVSTCPR